MKKTILLTLVVLLCFSSFSQNKKKPVYRKDKFNISASKPWKQLPMELNASPVKQSNSSIPQIFTQIGQTRYDCQTSGSTASRLYAYPDNTIGGTWMFGTQDPGFADRGTGYNYYNGMDWGLEPTTRIENVKTGYPSYAPFGVNGEATLAHDFSTPGGMILCKRDQKGTGNWSQLSIPGPAGQNGLAWPRMISSGTDHQYLHTIAITRPTAYPGGTIYQGMDGAILYSRSSDGGTTWDISNQLIPGMTSAEYNGFTSDSYSFAQAVDNNIAFVVGDTWTDLFLMKSTDNGSTWTKTVIFQHPYPKFDETTDLVTDTPLVCDGGVAVALDHQGKAHVFFGLMRVLNADTTDGTTSYFPYSDGLAYWNEDMAPFTNLNFDTLWNQNHIVASVPDMNGNDTVMEFVGIGTYYLSLTAMPTVAITQENLIILCYSTVMEDLNTGSENYRHLWLNYSYGGQTWNNPINLNGSIIYNFSECVFPFISPISPGSLYYHYLFQQDDEPGMATWGPDPLDPYTDNSIICTMNPLPVGIDEINDGSGVIISANPNPANYQTEISVDLQHTEKLSLEIRNSIGQLIYSTPTAQASAGKSYFKVDVSEFSSGMYFYTVKAGNSRLTNKLIVQH